MRTPARRRARAGAALVLLLAVGCDERSRSRADGTDRLVDAGRLDAGVDRDRGPDAPDARPDPPHDAGPDVATDAAADPPDGPVDARPLFYQATLHDGRTDCPRIGRGDPARGDSPWIITARVAFPDEDLGDRWVHVPISPIGEAGIPEYRAHPGTVVEALRPQAGRVFGLWREDPAGDLRVGPWSDRGWTDTGLGDAAPLTVRPGTFDVLALPGGGTAALLPADGRIVLVVDLGANALPATVEWPVERPQRARLVADDDGLIVAWSTADTLELRALDLIGEPRWQARFDIETPFFDVALRPGRVGVVHIADDPRLADRPYRASHGAPRIVVLHRSDGAELWRAPLHGDPILGGNPVIGARADGWLTAWVRLRVDGDRNRSEIEASRVVDERPQHPLRITRAHGYSFCPVVSEAEGDVSIITWLDTRFSREDVLLTPIDGSPWPGGDRPEPTPAPPAFAAACTDGVIAAIDGPVLALDAVPVGDGFSAVWVDRDGVLLAGGIDPQSGPTVRWRLDAAALGGARPTAVRRAPAAIGGVLFAEVDGRVRAWRTMPQAPFEDEPRAPSPLDVDFDPPLHDVAGGAGGVVAIVGDPPIVTRLVPSGPTRALPPDAGSPRVIAVDGGVVVAWVTGSAGESVIEWMRLPNEGADWGAVQPRREPIPGAVRPQRFDLRPHASGWAAIYETHHGRSYTRVVMQLAPESPSQPLRRLDLDAASSTGPVGDARGVLWLEQRPVERFQVHLRDDDAEAVERLPVDTDRRTRFVLGRAGDEPVVLWLSGVDARIGRFGPGCRQPAASEP